VHTAIHEEKDMEKSVTDFVNKYGKTRICKYLEQDWKKAGDVVEDANKAIQDSCKDDKQEDKEFIKVISDVLKKAKKLETKEFREALRHGT